MAVLTATAEPTLGSWTRARDRLRRVPTWGWLTIISTLTVLGHYPAVVWPLGPDESGYLTVAETWAPRPHSPYGQFFVDRSPISISFYWITGSIDGSGFVARAVVAGLAVVAVLAVYAACRALVGSRRPALVAAGAMGAWLAAPEVDAWQAKGEAWGVPLMAVSVWLVTAGTANSRHGAALGQVAGAGALAMVAFGAKQNLFDALVFGAVLLCLRRGGAWRGRLLAYALGALVPVAATVAWAATSGVAPDALAYQVVGFRFDANDALATDPSNASWARSGDLAGLALRLGLIPAVAVTVRACLVRGADGATRMAVLAALATSVVGVVAGGSYWDAYLIPPMLWASLGLGLALSRRRDTVALAGGVVAGWALVASVVTSIAYLHNVMSRTAVPTAANVASAVAASAKASDTVVVLGGRADVARASGLATPYPYQWHLIAQVLDPQRRELVRLLRGPDAPTWLVEYVPLEEWSRAARTQVATALASHYRWHGRACGIDIYVLRSESRPPLRQGCPPIRLW